MYKVKMKITKEKNNVKQGTNSYGRGIISINTGLSTKEKKKKKNKKLRGRKPFAMQNLASPVFCFCLPLIQSRVFFLVLLLKSLVLWSGTRRWSIPELREGWVNQVGD